MLPIVAVFGILLVNTNALNLALDSLGGIPTPEIRKAFDKSMKSRNQGLEWDSGLAGKEALAEAKERGSSKQPLVIYHKWKTQDIHQSSIPLIPGKLRISTNQAYPLHTLPMYSTYITGCGRVVIIEGFNS